VSLPLVAPDDDMAFRIALSALGRGDPASVRAVWIRNTGDLGDLLVSRAVVDDLPDAATVRGAVDVRFADGTATVDRR
jgi:hypothetical protein